MYAIKKMSNKPDDVTSVVGPSQRTGGANIYHVNDNTQRSICSADIYRSVYKRSIVPALIIVHHTFTQISTSSGTSPAISGTKICPMTLTPSVTK